MMNNTINEIKNSLEGIKSRITEAEERICDLEDKTVEMTTTEQNKEKRMKRIKDSLRDLWNNIKCTNIRIIGAPEEEEKKKGTEKIFEEITVENFPNMGKERVNQVQEAQRVPYRKNPGRNTSRHILIKLSKITYRASLVVQWLRICLPMQGTRVRALVWEVPTCRGATRPVSHNY